MRAREGVKKRREKKDKGEEKNYPILPPAKRSMVYGAGALIQFLPVCDMATEKNICRKVRTIDVIAPVTVCSNACAVTTRAQNSVRCNTRKKNPR